MGPNPDSPPGPRKRSLSINTTDLGSNGRDGAANGELTVAAGEAVVPLSPAARLFHEPHFNCHIVAALGIGRAVDVDAIKAGLEVTLVRHPRFSSLLVLDKNGIKKPKWVRAKVAIDNHVIVPTLDPQSSSSPDQLVEDYVASLSTAGGLDPSRPLWELHILNFPTSEAEAVVVFRIHHSLGDGISLTSLLLACTRQTSDNTSLPTIPGSQPAAKHRRFGVVSAFLWVWSMLVLAWHTAVEAVVFMATVVFLRDTETPVWPAAEGVEFRRKRILHRTISLDDLKAIKNALGCTINDVLIGLTSAGLSSYLSRKYGEKGLPSKIRLRTTLLVNIRPTPGIHALAKMMEGGGSTRWGNWLGYVVLPFPIGKFKDPLDYVRKGMAIAALKKNSLEALLSYNFAYLIVKLFGIKAAAALCYRVLRHTTISFSNIVGPVEEIGFFGHPLVYIAPSVYGHPQAVTLHYQSYMNKMKVVLAVDELAVPDPHQLLDDLVESLKQIKNGIKTDS